jgi:hypothetical protein
MDNEERINRVRGCWLAFGLSGLLWSIIIGCGYLLYPIIVNIK